MFDRRARSGAGAHACIDWAEAARICAAEAATRVQCPRRHARRAVLPLENSVVLLVVAAVRNLVGLAMAMMMTHNAPSSRMRRPDERTVSLVPFLVLWRVAGETGPQRASSITWTRGVE